MIKELEEYLNSLNIDIEVDSTTIEVAKKMTTIFSCDYEQYPACCGIVILNDFEFSYLYNAHRDVIKRVIKAFITDMAKDPDCEGPDIAEGPYGSVIISDTREWFKDLLVEIGFKLVNEFENPKTEHEIYTLIYTA